MDGSLDGSLGGSLGGDMGGGMVDNMDGGWVATRAATRTAAWAAAWAAHANQRSCEDLSSFIGFARGKAGKARINLGRLIVLYYDVTRLPASSRATVVALETCRSGMPHAGTP